ncbi:MAG: SH3 domain-containing protein, partial [Cyanobacteriota bacterium]|nr:SH3 domain-containing protein [Cyanobacteriota bacterium]
MGVVLRWGWVLGVALLAPADLPAGGAERRQPEIRRSDRSGPLLAGTSCELRVSP